MVRGRSRDKKIALLASFDSLLREPDKQRRGYALERLLTRVFEMHKIPVLSSFRRNAGAEQIDGAFKLDGWHYLFECRFRARPATIREIDGLLGQVDRSGKQTMGLVLSMNSWSPQVPDLLRQNRSKAIILMNREDLRAVLEQRIGLARLLSAKSTRLNLYGEPFFSASAACLEAALEC